MHRYLIIGSGAAGVAAAEAIRDKDVLGEILFVSEDRDGFYSRPGLAYMLSGEIPEKQLFPFNHQDFKKLNVHFVTGRVTRIDRTAHQVMLTDGHGADKTLGYTRLLIATGALASQLRMPGADLEGVVKLDDMADARQIQKLARKARAGVVVGGGITALEIVEGLVAQGVHTHYCLRGDRFWSNVLNPAESRLIEERLVHDGIELHYNTELAEIIGQKGKVKAVRTHTDQVIPCDLVGAAIGITPRKQLAEAAGLAADRGILVNEILQTNDPDIFAAGDVAQVLDPLSGKYLLNSLWAAAVRQGRAAGLAMSGYAEPYTKEPALNITRLAGLTTTIIGMVGGEKSKDTTGINRGDSETWRESPDAVVIQADQRGNRLRLMIGPRKLAGALVMGDQTFSPVLQKLVLSQSDITPIRDRLLQPGAAIGEILTEYWKQIKRQNETHQP